MTQIKTQTKGWQTLSVKGQMFLALCSSHSVTTTLIVQKEIWIMCKLIIIYDPYYLSFLALQKTPSCPPPPVNILPRITSIQCQYLKLSKWLQYVSKVENNWLININSCVYCHKIGKISCSICTNLGFWLQNPMLGLSESIARALYPLYSLKILVELSQNTLIV